MQKGEGGAYGKSDWKGEIAGGPRRVQDRGDGRRKDGRSEGSRARLGLLCLGEQRRRRLRDIVLGTLNEKRQN